MKYKQIHFTGIKGVGMTPLAIIAHEAGAVVTGSDMGETFITDEALKKAGIFPIVGFAKEHVLGADLVITTGAHGGFSNPEVVYAKELGIPVWTQGQAVGEFMTGNVFGNKQLTGVSVAGSHGKTTTTAMIATILNSVKLDPSYVIGTSDIASLGQPGHFGKSPVFIAEADEYATEPQADRTPKFLWQHPKILVFTNIELDHPDMYTSVDELREVFLTFAKQLPQDGVLIVCGDNPETQKLLKECRGNVITYGFSPANDYVITQVRISGLQTFFWLENKSTNLGQITLRVSGEHNALNSVASLLVAQELGVSFENAKNGLLSFTGTKRRMEVLGETKDGMIVIDDYAHHPTEVVSTLKAISLSYPNSTIITIFQPHTYSRTKILFNDFSTAFGDTDILLLMDIFASARESIDISVSSAQLAAQIKNTKVVHLPTNRDVLEYLSSQKLSRHSVIITMGAGDVYEIGKKLISG